MTSQNLEEKNFKLFEKMRMKKSRAVRLKLGTDDVEAGVWTTPLRQ